LVPAIASHEPQRVIGYSPLVAKTGLFKRFAETSQSEKEILKFANRYGCLGGTLSTAVRVDGESALSLHAESLKGWREAIEAMSEMLLIWESATKQNLTRLSSRIYWHGAAVSYKKAGAYELIASEKTSPEVLERFSTGDIVQPALYLLQRRVNAQLAQHGVSPRLLWDSGEGKLVMRLGANSLIGALWLQFARAIEGNKDYKQCQNCRDWMEVGGNRTARSDKKFCTPSCRTAAHRRKDAEEK